MTRKIAEIITCDKCPINRLATGKTKPERDKQIEDWGWTVTNKTIICSVCKE